MYPDPSGVGAELHPIDMPQIQTAPASSAASGGSGTSWLILAGVVLAAGAIGWYVTKGK